MTNKEKFIEVFGLNLCYCGNPDHSGLFYITETDDCKDVFLDKFEAKKWLESEYKDSDIVAHCNVMENAELIAEILDADSIGEVYKTWGREELDIIMLWLRTKFDLIIKELNKNIQE